MLNVTIFFWTLMKTDNYQAIIIIIILMKNTNSQCSGRRHNNNLLNLHSQFTPLQFD